MINQMINEIQFNKNKITHIGAIPSLFKYTFMGLELSITNKKKDHETIILAQKRY